MSDKAKEYLKSQGHKAPYTILFIDDDIHQSADALLQKYANQETEQLQKEVERLEEENETLVDDFFEAMNEQVDKVEFLSSEIMQLKQTNKELIDLLIDCANFIQPYDDGGNEAERLIKKIELLTKTKEE